MVWICDKCGFSLETYIYPIYCKCGNIVQAEQKHPCPHYLAGVCEVASEIAGLPVIVPDEVCLACIQSPRPMRLNNQTATLAYCANPEIDKERLEKVIDGNASGFGTALSNTLGMFFEESANCGCPGHKDILDVWTPAYIQSHMDHVVNWLQQAASTRGIPFSRVLTRLLLEGLIRIYSTAHRAKHHLDQ